MMAVVAEVLLLHKVSIPDPLNVESAVVAVGMLLLDK